MNIVYGGSFNPPTKAHKLIIDKLFQIFMPDNIIVVPVGNSYGKKGLIEFSHRYNMAKLLDNRVVICDFEDKEEYTGTYRTSRPPGAPPQGCPCPASRCRAAGGAPRG